MISEALWVVEIPQGGDLDHCRVLGNHSRLSVPPSSSVLFSSDSVSIFSVWHVSTTVCLFAIGAKQWGQWIIDHFQHNLTPKCNDYFYRWIFIKSIILQMGFIYISNAKWPTHTSNVYYFFMVNPYKYTSLGGHLYVLFRKENCPLALLLI